MVIWKYVLTLSEIQVIEMPKDAKVLAFQMQLEWGEWGDNTSQKPTIWCAIPDKSVHAPKVHRRFRIFVTDHHIPETLNQEYLGTVQDGIFVWHLFEEMI